jgi:hypothetical protein
MTRPKSDKSDFGWERELAATATWTCPEFTRLATTLDMIAVAYFVSR